MGECQHSTSAIQNGVQCKEFDQINFHHQMFPLIPPVFWVKEGLRGLTPENIACVSSYAPCLHWKLFIFKLTNYSVLVSYFILFYRPSFN